ncbi:hypothetical protein LMTR3_03075 [Bradyrhizobium sp. LMTR 3]|nr:hypothetical protein LMTR3_03075 [Bradyrhizobium sp. LMTR 3]
MTVKKIQALLSYNEAMVQLAVTGGKLRHENTLRALKCSDCATQQLPAELANGGWSRNQEGKPAQSSAASD